MTKRLTALGFALVGVVWGPYVYAELARKPLTPVASEPASPVIEPTAVSYETSAQERAQLMAALTEQRKVAAAAEPEHSAPTEPAPAEPAAAEPAAPEAADPGTAALPPAAANAETAAAAATDTALAAAQPATDHPPQPAAAPEAAPQPAAAVADPSAKPDEPAHASAAKEAGEADAKHEEHSDDRHDEKAEKADDKHDDKKEAAATPESLAPAFRSAFDRESRDAAWANGEEPRLAQMLAGAGVPASAIGEVRCQSTVCRVALTSVDAKAVQQSPLYQLLYQRVRDEFGTLGLDSAGSDGEQHAAFYVLRKGAELSRDTN